MEVIRFQSSSNKRTLQEALSVLIRKKASSNDPRPKAIVFDIDGTVLYNNPSCGTKKRVEAAFEIYNWALFNGVSVFFVTARPDFANDHFNRILTENDLQRHGFKEKTRLIMRPVHSVAVNYLTTGAVLSKFKRECRDEIARSYQILMSLGDSISDIIELGAAGPYQALLQKPLISSLRSYLLYLPENNPDLNVKLKNEYLSDLEDIAMGDPRGYQTNKAALELGFELIRKRFARRSGKATALVFDIDGTVIYNYMKKPKDPKKPGMQSEAQRRVPESFAIIQWALKNDVAVFFVTARIDDPENRQFAVDDLAKSGYTQYTALFLWPGNTSVANYKAERRCAIARNYSILMSFGDSIHDLVNTEVNNHFQEALSQIDRDRAYVLRLPHNDAKFNVKLHLEKLLD